VTLPAFTAARRRVRSTATAARPLLSIDISCLQGAQQKTHKPVRLSIDGTDRRTKGRTDAQPLYKPCCAYSVNNSLSNRQFPAT